VTRHDSDVAADDWVLLESGTATQTTLRTEYKMARLPTTNQKEPLIKSRLAGPPTFTTLANAFPAVSSPAYKTLPGSG
jgi:hypothetical protein